MNGKQTIEFQDDNLLSSLGFVSGDSIYIMGIQSQDEPAAKNVKSDKAASMVEQKQDLRNKSHPVQSVAVEQPSTSSEKDGQYISVCDTPPSAVPQALEELMKKSKMTSSSSAFELIAGLLHILMVETGFIPVTKNLEGNAYIALPDSWQDNGHGTLRLCYKAALSPNSPCTIIVSAMNHLIVVHGAVSDVSRSMKLKPSDYLPLIGGNRLRQLSLSFKNEISFPLLVSMQRQAEGYCPANLSNLPAEMLYSILSRLDVKSLCRLSATSRFFREISNRPEMWKKLVLR